MLPDRSALHGHAVRVLCGRIGESSPHRDECPGPRRLPPATPPGGQLWGQLQRKSSDLPMNFRSCRRTSLLSAAAENIGKPRYLAGSGAFFIPALIEERTTNMQATFIPPENMSQWLAAPCFTLGTPSSPMERPVASVGVSSESGELWRIDLFGSLGHSCFQDLRCVGELVYIGHGEQVAVFSPKTGSLVSHSLDGYFGHLFTASDLDSCDLGSSVLVASASELLRFDSAGELLWRSSTLGIDGVIVHRVQDGEIVGDAEQDPPGGWQPFRLRMDAGDLRTSAA